MATTTPLLPHNLADMVETTLKRYRKKKWVDLSLDLTDYFAMSRLFRNKRIKEGGGTKINWKVQTDKTETARTTELFDTDDTQVKDLLTGAECPWALMTVNWSYDEREPQFNSGKAQLLDEIMVREHAAWSDMAELMEEHLWGSGPTSTTQRRPPPFSIPWWIPQNATQGFNGGGASGYETDVAGIDPTAVAAWNPWTDTYQQFTRKDLVYRLKYMGYKSRFKPPHSYAQLDKADPDRTFCTTWEVSEQLDQLSESRNDNLGKDLGTYQGNTVLKGAPFVAIPYLDENTTNNPIYQIDWRVFKPCVKKGLDMKRHRPLQAQGNTGHNTFTVYVDHSQQYICYNRRRLGVMYKV